jgi:hypothetical protein
MTKKLFVILLFIPFFLSALVLRDNLALAEKGDYIVTLQNRNFTVLVVTDKQGQTITIQEVTVPDETRGTNTDWKRWVETNAPGNTSWVMYTIDIPSGNMMQYYNFYYQTWYDMSEANVFLSKLLNLELTRVPNSQRKKVGASHGKRLWQPPLVVEGSQIFHVPFDAFTTHWPKDGSPLSDRKVQIYLPEENSKYPSYFPYWLEVSGGMGKAQVRIVDSGRQLISPRKVANESNL